MIFGLFRSRDDQRQTLTLYGVIVAQARQPVFYSELGVPDTLEGRFEMLILHAFLYLHRLKDEDEAAKEVAQKVFDAMFTDMDQSLREIGIGDLTVPKKIKKMAGAFYGRAAAYDAALVEGREALASAVQRNVYSDNSDERANAEALSDYMIEAVNVLAGQSKDDLTGKGPVFPQPKVPHNGSAA